MTIGHQQFIWVDLDPSGAARASTCKTIIRRGLKARVCAARPRVFRVFRVLHRLYRIYVHIN